MNFFKQLRTAGKVFAILTVLYVLSAVGSLISGNFSLALSSIVIAAICAALCWYFHKHPAKPKQQNQPTAVPAYSYNDVDIYVFDNTDPGKLRLRMSVELRPEPENEHDPDAVAVYCSGDKIGYLYRNKLQRMYHDFYKDGGYVTAEVSLVSPKIQLKLQFFK